MILCLHLVFGACFCSCAQSGNGRHNSHQRKIHQQEESCQNLTDFTPARVPSKVDIFTAYNDSLQCSHECVRTAVPIYTDEMIQQTPVFKTSYNGNRCACALLAQRDSLVTLEVMFCLKVISNEDFVDLEISDRGWRKRKESLTMLG